MAPFVHRLQEDTMPSTSSTSGSVLYHAHHVNVARIAVLVFLGLPILLVLGIGLLLLVGHSKNPALLVLTTPPSLLAIAAAVVLTRLRFTVSTSGLTIVNFLVTHRLAWHEVQVIRTSPDFFLRGATTVHTRDGRSLTALVTTANYAMWRGESFRDHGEDLRSGGRPAHAAIDAHRRYLAGEFGR